MDLISIDTKALEKPALKLVQAVERFVGPFLEPIHIRAKARAEADAEVIRARGHAKASDIRERSRLRCEASEVRRQHNIETITRNAFHQLPGEVSDAPVDSDWVAQFYNLCQDVSNEQLQVLWAKLLAGEVSRPGSFSLRTLNLVKVISRRDAELFTSFCVQVWRTADGPVPVAEARNSGIGGRQTLAELVHLESLGVIRCQPLPGFSMELDADVFEISYFERRCRVVTAPNRPKALNLGSCLLTAIGGELAPICGARADWVYCDQVVKWWRSHNHEVVLTNPDSHDEPLGASGP